jgi:hypothetical protein
MTLIEPPPRDESLPEVPEEPLAPVIPIAVPIGNPTKDVCEVCRRPWWSCRRGGTIGRLRLTGRRVLTTTMLFWRWRNPSHGDSSAWVVQV